MDRAVGVCKKVVSAFSYSWKKKSALSKAQQRLNLPTHQLITESPTRWGSRQKMVARVLEQQKAIIDVLSADKNNRHLIPTWQDIEVLESMNAALTPLLEKYILVVQTLVQTLVQMLRLSTSAFLKFFFVY